MMAVSRFRAKNAPNITRRVKKTVDRAPAPSYRLYSSSVVQPWRVRACMMDRHAHGKLSKVVNPPLGIIP